MSSTTPAANPQLEGSMFLFRQPSLLNRERHGSLGVSRPERPFAYAEKVRAIPLVVSEVITAARFFPVIFSDATNPLPLAVVGIVDDENLFVKPEGTWEDHVYIPAYLRRYPFALANDSSADAQNPRMAMIVDDAYEGITEGADVPFFDADGNPSTSTKAAMEYCQNYERDRNITLQLARQLPQYGLLAEQMAQFTPEGADSPMPFARYTGVDENKLQELADDKFLEMRKSNLLPVLYAQLTSMGNWRTLMERRARKHNLKGMEVMQPRQGA